MNDSDLPHVIVTGNVEAGFRLHGPFPNAIEAIEYAEQNGYIADFDWVVLPIHPPN